MSAQPPKKEPRGHLRFSLSRRRGEQLDGSSIPVEVRRLSLALAHRCLSTDVAELDAGDYIVTAQLPSGQVLSGSIALPPGQDRTVQLEWEENEPAQKEPSHSPFSPSGQWLNTSMPEARFPVFMFRTLTSFRSSPGLLRCLVPSVPPGWESADRIRAAWLHADELKVTWKAVRFHSTTQRDGRVELRAPEDSPTVVQFLQPRAAPINIVLPISEKPGQLGCRILVERDSAHAFQVDIRLDNSRADTLLRYSQAGDRERALLSQRALSPSESDPVGAAISAYAFLRFKAAQEFPPWTQELSERFPWFADGAVIWAEHQARLGRHGQALKVLLLLWERGLPLFSAGLSYAVDRLRAYTKSSPDSWPRGKAPIEVELVKAQSLLDLLSRYAACADFSRPVTTYPGASPSVPGEEPGLERLAPSPMDVDLLPYFRD